MTDSTPRLAGAGAIFIDDIVQPDGRTYMQVLGGGVVHAMLGAVVWGERPGLIALAGHDLPPAIEQRLAKYLDLQGLHYLDIPQIRAWQVFEHDGTRRELYRVAETMPFIRGAQSQHFPLAYQTTQGFYLLQNFDDVSAWCDRLKDKIILWEPPQQIMTATHQDRFRAVLHDHKIDIVSPNLAEAQAIYGQHDSRTLLENMLHDGAQIAIIRLGSQGSLVGNQQGEVYKIPPAPITKLIDQTGAGNTYCGAFLAASVAGANLLEAGVKAAVAAAYCLEQIGVIDPTDITNTERNARYNTTLALTQQYNV